MTRENIIKLAREAGFEVDAADFITAPKTNRTGFQLELERFARLVAAAEREACAKVCDVQIEMNRTGTAVAKSCVKLIRRRGEQ